MHGSILATDQQEECRGKSASPELHVQLAVHQHQMAFTDAVLEGGSRSLFVYSDTGGSSVVGKRVTELLREVKFSSHGQGSQYFEPIHIQYIPVRKQVFDIIEVNVAETTGELARLGKGNTILTLPKSTMIGGTLRRFYSRQLLHSETEGGQFRIGLERHQDTCAQDTWRYFDQDGDDGCERFKFT